MWPFKSKKTEKVIQPKNESELALERMKHYSRLLSISEYSKKTGEPVTISRFDLLTVHNCGNIDVVGKEQIYIGEFKTELIENFANGTQTIKIENLFGFRLNNPLAKILIECGDLKFLTEISLMHSCESFHKMNSSFYSWSLENSAFQPLVASYKTQKELKEEEKLEKIKVLKKLVEGLSIDEIKESLFGENSSNIVIGEYHFTKKEFEIFVDTHATKHLMNSKINFENRIVDLWYKDNEFNSYTFKEFLDIAFNEK